MFVNELQITQFLHLLLFVHLTPKRVLLVYLISVFFLLQVKNLEKIAVVRVFQNVYEEPWHLLLISFCFPLDCYDMQHWHTYIRVSGLNIFCMFLSAFCSDVTQAFYAILCYYFMNVCH